MLDSKPWYQSRTMWAGIATALTGISGLALPVPPTVTSTLSILGGLLTAYFRAQTTTTIEGTSAEAESKSIGGI